MTRNGIASEVRGQMKSAVFYFRHDEYAEVRRGNSIPYLNDLVRTQIVDLDQDEALEFAHRNARPGETVLNSVLLEE